MKKEGRIKFALKRMEQNQYTITFAKGVDIDLVNTDSFIKKNIDWIFFNSEKNSGEIYIGKGISLEEVQNRFAMLFSLSDKDISIKEKSIGLSNLYPL
ncbi:hypothetical protein M2139_000454 [Enterococcus sp. PF1-24]|uniref:hypothetical protein n=1 Tax=unclassified Enterococcus TaxID=2608891 RepID=UPI002474B1E4|nr:MULTISPECIES: hypothetical protein [unclassified Enterococcus]MDH6363479.1 hypothetical protein [Enterococcus sp. PFB1-1]MDH6400573.1 hypothetical protein [Enterococcus sp. PF1-24]